MRIGRSKPLKCQYYTLWVEPIMAEKARGTFFPVMLPCTICREIVDEMGKMFIFLLDALRLMFAGWGQF